MIQSRWGVSRAVLTSSKVRDPPFLYENIENEGGLISVGRPGSRGAPQTVSALKALSFEFKIFRHSEARVPNGRIP